MTFPWQHTNTSDDYEEYTLESTHLFRWLFVGNDLVEKGQPWENAALALLADPREYLEKTRIAWDDYNRQRGDTFGNYVGLGLMSLEPLTVRIFCTAFYANGFPCEFSAIYENGTLTDLSIGH